MMNIWAVANILLLQNCCNKQLRPYIIQAYL